MNLTHEQSPESNIQTCQREVTEIYGDVGYTNRRFALVQPPDEQTFTHDLLLANPHESLSRIIVTEKARFDREAYEQIQQLPDVPQLPLISETDNVLTFGVPAGMKPLSRERRHSRESSATYISDNEIMGRLGFMYGRIWKGTGLMVENPYDHAGIVNFADDEQHYLFLVPPYDTQKVEYFQDAYKSFTVSLIERLRRPYAVTATGLPSQHRGVSDDFLLAAQDGFRMGAY